MPNRHSVRCGTRVRRMVSCFLPLYDFHPILCDNRDFPVSIRIFTASYELTLFNLNYDVCHNLRQDDKLLKVVLEGATYIKKE